MSDSDAPRPRLCHLRKWPDFNGYGFNLHAERGKAGQFIGNVDPDSPAVAAALRPGDRIVQVNGTSIGSENHQQVVQRIKAVPGETKLLVVDQEADNYYKDRKMVVPSDMYSVDVCEAPATNPFTNPSPGTTVSLLVRLLLKRNHGNHHTPRLPVNSSHGYLVTRSTRHTHTSHHTVNSSQAST